MSAAQRNNANQSLQDFENDIKLVQDKLTNKIKRNSENIANEDNLLSSVMSLKSAAQGMNEEIKLQNSFLNKVETNFIRKTDKLKVINKRLDRLIDAASGSCLIGTILMLVVILVLIIIVL